MMLANAGADSVVAIEAHDTVCQIARKNIALHGLGNKVSGCEVTKGGHERGSEYVCHMQLKSVDLCGHRHCMRTEINY